MIVNWEPIRLRDSKGNFTRFILPIQFPDHAFGPIVEHLQERRGQGGLLKQQNLAPDGLLPHIRRHLNLGGRTFDATRSLGSFWEVSALTIDGTILPSEGWICSIRGSDERSKFGVPFMFGPPQIALFRTGIAFLSIEVRPTNLDPRDWFDLTHFLKFMAPGRERLLSHPDEDLSITMPIIMRSLAELLETPGMEPLEFEFTFEDHSASKGDSLKTFSSSELMHFGSVFLDGASPSDHDDLRERARSGFHSKQDVASKSDSQTSGDEMARLIYQDQQSFEFTVSSSVFVGFEMQDTQFTTHNLPTHFREIYFLLFLFVHSQRLALAILTDEVFEAIAMTASTSTPLLTKQLNDIVELDRRLLEYTGSSYFLQVTQQHHHHTYYTRLRSYIQIQAFFQEVKDEIDALRFYVSSLVQREADRRSNQLQIAVTALTVVFVPAGVLLTLFAPKIPLWPGVRDLSATESALITVGILVFTSFTLWIFRLRLRKRGDR